MKISGIELAKTIRPIIKAEAETLVSHGIKPMLAIITLGESDGWEAYVRQKTKWANKLSMETSVINLQNADTATVLAKIDELNADRIIHGIIVQRPMPSHIDKEEVINQIIPEKDVDGFRSDSPYEVPVWLAVKQFLTHISIGYEDSLTSYLKGKKIVIVGKGETAGAPIANGIKALGFDPTIIDSNTKNPDTIIKESDIVISCVGKNVIEKSSMHENQIFIGVGIRNEEGKLKGDFDEIEAEECKTIYTPTPGGVGPLNLTYLLQNTLQAAQFFRDEQIGPHI